MIKSRFLFTISFFILAQSAFAQFSLDGQFRTRAELRNGYRALATDQNYALPLVSQRSRLVFNYIESDYEFRFAAQDARVWGQNWNSLPSSSIHIHEAWAAYMFNSNLSLKIGRQELKYDDQRIMAARNFSITGATYDAALLVFNNKSKGIAFHWGTMVNNAQEATFLEQYSFPSSFKYITFLWAEKKFSDGLRVNGLNFFDLTQNPTNPHIMYGRNTIGANAIFSTSDVFGGRLGGYYQFGEAWLNLGALVGQDNYKVSAYSYNATLWIRPVESLKISFNVDTYSGHDWSSTSSTFTGFNRLLAAGHAHIGHIDYFTSMDLAEVNRAGINDFFVSAEVKMNSKLTLHGVLHHFSLHKPYFPSAAPEGYVKVDPNLGTEVDLIANYRVNKIFSLELAFMTIFPTKTLELIKMTSGEATFSHYAYVSLLFTPRFFDWKRPETIND